MTGVRQLPADLPAGLVELLIPVLDGDVDVLVLDEDGVAELVSEALEETLAFGTVRVHIEQGSIRCEARSLLMRLPSVTVTPTLDGGRLTLRAQSTLPVRSSLAKAQRRCDAVGAVLAEQGRVLSDLRVADGCIVLSVSPVRA